ncbi:hypothetical protein RND71_019524 [Anisodus tanguticus]|uniref:Uncharacterized protein n=1 Tax=Anisodus tanguticus TaxID=243964 RepID=A0AAE1S0N6_9SOLA|nr:hypothetical protein RND71_019524 [Anisodus tanguticus]
MKDSLDGRLQDHHIQDMKVKAHRPFHRIKLEPNLASKSESHKALPYLTNILLKNRSLHALLEFEHPEVAEKALEIKFSSTIKS